MGGFVGTKSSDPRRSLGTFSGSAENNFEGMIARIGRRRRWRDWMPIENRRQYVKDPDAGFKPECSISSLTPRREMLKKTLMAGLFLPQMLRGQRGRGRRSFVDPSQIPAYRYKTLPVSRFRELQAEYDKSLAGPLFSQAKAFRDDVAKLSFKIPANFPAAKSVIVVAAFTKSMYVTFTLNGAQLRLLVPPQYYADDMTPAKLQGIVQKEIIKNTNNRIVEISDSVPLKLLAARSGLGMYGKNNLIFVDGMGSYNLLYAFLTDYPFPEDSWTQLSMLGRCYRCDRCDRSCPTACFSNRSFPINVARCVTLYNERQGEFPNWLLRSGHSALMGCLLCQDACPEDGGYSEISGMLEEVSEEETRRILKGIADDALLKSLQRKLRQFPATASKEVFPILTRNLSALTR
jgi:epoxyqueuosine reductase